MLHRFLPGQLAWLAALAAALVPACSGESEVHAAGQATTHVTLELPLDDSGEVEGTFELEEWIEGDAELELVGMTRKGAQADGERAAWVEVETEAEGPRELLVLSHSRDARLWSAPLPGKGARPVRLRFQASPTYLWLSARIAQHAPEPATSPLAGSLRGRNVVLFLTDALAAGHMSCYGNARPTTPHLDRLAEEGVRFANAYSQTSWTLPSVASLFTSLEQERHRVQRMTDQLDEGTGTLAELFRAAGYRTSALVQNGVVWSHTGLDRGFDSYRLFEWKAEAFVDLLEATRAALSETSDRPLFLYVHMIPPHGPFMAPADLRERFDPDYDGPVDGSIEQARALVERRPQADHADVRHLAALYDAYLCHADRELGKLLEAVRLSGREEEFLFVHLSDHGEAFFEHEILGHEVHVFEEQVRIPLILHAAGSRLPSGRVVESPASILDVLPTLVELCELSEQRTPSMGRSLLGAIDGETGSDAARSLVLSSRYRSSHPSRQIAMVAGGYKWLVHRTRASRRGELFDLALDPSESRDVAAEHPLRASAMDRWLLRWEAQARDGTGTDARALETHLDADARAQLQQLGYTSED